MVKGMIRELDYFTDCICSACANRGVSYYIIDTNDAEKTTGSELNEFVAAGDAVLFCFNNIGTLLTEGNENFWEKYNVPVYSFIVDHPRNFGDMLNQPIKNYHLICLDKNHKAFVERYYHKIEKVYFVPNGGEQVANTQDFSERKTDVSYFGDCQQKVRSFPILEFFADGGKEFYDRCISLMREEPDITTEEVIERMIGDYYPGVADDSLRQINEVVAIYIECVARRFYKQKMMRALSEAGVCVEIYGNYWEDDEYSFGENIHIHPRIAPEECNRLMGESKITLNFLPWYKKGSSERPYNSMLNGSVCLIDESRFLEEEGYENEKNILYFDMSEPEKAVDKIKELLSESGTVKLENIAKRGCEKAILSDTWDKRAERILQIVEDDHDQR